MSSMEVRDCLGVVQEQRWTWKSFSKSKHSKMLLAIRTDAKNKSDQSTVLCMPTSAILHVQSAGALGQIGRVATASCSGPLHSRPADSRPRGSRTHQDSRTGRALYSDGSPLLPCSGFCIPRSAELRLRASRTNASIRTVRARESDGRPFSVSRALGALHLFAQPNCFVWRVGRPAPIRTDPMLNSDGRGDFATG